MADKPALRPDIAIGRALTEAAWSILDEARAPLAERTMPDAEVVHDIRKALKRWRALLRLIGPFLGERKAHTLRIGARDLARGLAGARDPRSALDALADLADANPRIPSRSLESARKRIDRLRLNAETTVLTEDMRAQLKLEFTNTAEVIGGWSIGEPTFHDVADSLSDTYRRARKAIPDDWGTANADELHELRKRVVEHRYQMELIEPLWPRLGRLWVGEAQRLRDRLGRHHDLTTLAALARRDKALAASRTRLAPIIHERQRDHVQTAARIAGRLFAEKPGAFRNRLLRLWKSRADTLAE
jgi:CHAD domain-containing protein